MEINKRGPHERIQRKSRPRYWWNVRDRASGVQLIQQTEAEGLFVRCDVSKSVDVEVMVRQVEGVYGRLDFAFNNAGVVPKAGR